MVAQVVYYFRGYLAATTSNDQKVSFTVPSGNFGNVCAGHIARMMGLPIDQLVVATNENDVLHRLIQTGEYVDTGAQITSSPSMDISKASNYERIVHDLFGPEFTAKYMERFRQNRKVSFGEIDEKLKDFRLTDIGFMSGMSTHADRIDSIKWVYEQNGDVIDPHTADSITVARRLTHDVPTICTETALAVKFEKTITEALDFVPDREARFKDIESELEAESGFEIMGNDIDALKTFISTNSRAA